LTIKLQSQTVIGGKLLKTLLFKKVVRKMFGEIETSLEESKN